MMMMVMMSGASRFTTAEGKTEGKKESGQGSKYFWQLHGRQGEELHENAAGKIQ